MAYLSDENYCVHNGCSIQFALADGTQAEIPLEVFDRVAVMRYAQLHKNGDLTRVTNEAVATGGLGADALRAMVGVPGAVEEHDQVRSG